MEHFFDVHLKCMNKKQDFKNERIEKYLCLCSQYGF